MAIDKNQRADITHICVNDSRNEEKLKLLTDTVHKFDSKIIAQISYSGHHGSKMEGQIAKTPSGLGNTVAFSKEDIEQCIINNALKIRNEVNIPVILVGGFRNTNQMNNALEKGIDFISMSRPFIADENFIEKLRNGEESICINCNKCFEVFKTQHKRCILRDDIIHQLEINFPY